MEMLHQHEYLPNPQTTLTKPQIPARQKIDGCRNHPTQCTAILYGQKMKFALNVIVFVTPCPATFVGPSPDIDRGYSRLREHLSGSDALSLENPTL